MPAPTPVRRRLLRTKQAAEYLSCSPWTLRRLTQEGRIPVVQATPESPFTFDVHDLDRFIEQHKRSSPWDTSSL
jgi:excisionase family DNA binding protein